MLKEQKKVLEEKIKLLERTKKYMSEKINVIEQLLHFENDYELEKNIQYTDTDIMLYRKRLIQSI